MGRKQVPVSQRIPQGRAPLPQAGQVTRDDPTSPQLDSITNPSQLDRRAPFEDDASPSRLDFELLSGRVVVLTGIVRRLMQLLPASAQGELTPILDDVEPLAPVIDTAEA